MNEISFKETGGFPLTTDVLNAMQNAYTIFNSLGEIAGDYSIIKGCVESSNSVSDGVIYVKDEVFNFKGGLKTSNIVLRQNVGFEEFEDGGIKEVYFDRFYEFGSGTESIPWSRFQRFENLVTITKKTEVIGSELNTAKVNITDLINRVISLENKPDNTVLAASARDVDARIRNDVYVSPATLPVYQEATLFTGEVAANGRRVSYFKNNFSSKRIGAGLYRITHNMQITNYGVSGSAVDRPNMKVSMKKRTASYCELGVSNDVSLDDVNFSFQIYRV